MNTNQKNTKGSLLGNGLKYVALGMLAVGGVTYCFEDLMNMLPKQYDVSEIDYQPKTLDDLIAEMGENVGKPISITCTLESCDYFQNVVGEARANLPAETLRLLADTGDINKRLLMRFQTTYYGPYDDPDRTNGKGEYIPKLDVYKSLLNKIHSDQQTIEVRGFVSNESREVLLKRMNPKRKYTAEEFAALPLETTYDVILLCQFFTYIDANGKEHTVSISTNSDEIENAILRCDIVKNKATIERK